MTALPAIRATIPQLVGFGDRAMAQYGVAYDALQEAHELASQAAPSTHRRYDLSGSAHRELLGQTATRRQAARDEYLGQRRRELDQAIWSHVIDATKLEQLMDAKAHEQFRRELRDSPPAATVDNILATLEQFAADAGSIFERGLATAFSRLDRRFRSHDGFKVGSRLCFDWTYSGGHLTEHRRDTIRDVERVFYVLDGKELPERGAGIVGQMQTYRLEREFPFEVESDYFRVRGFKRGSVHLWFKRKDLVERVNQLLARYYGEVLGASPDAAAEAEPESGKGPLPRPPMPANFGFYETLGPARDRVMDKVLYGCSGKRILEPSAGRGALARPLAEAGAEVTCIEVQPPFAQELAASGLFAQVLNRDFFDVTPDELGLFDVVVANPPFGRGLDVDHVTHMLGFVKPGGRLVAVMAAGVEFREDRRHAGFRARISRVAGQAFERCIVDMPERAFAAVGTNVNTVLLSVVIK